MSINSILLLMYSNISPHDFKDFFVIDVRNVYPQILSISVDKPVDNLWITKLV